jgi:hypothetical protein
VFKKIINIYRTFNEKREKRSIAKNLKTIKNPKAIKDDRALAIDFFCNFKDPKIAIPALLQRFEYSLDHGINDSREKESTLKGIVSFGDKGKEIIEEHILSTLKIAWPLKIYEQLASEKELLDLLLSCLDYSEVDFDHNKLDKNYDILCRLRDFKITGEAQKVTHFLKQHDERLRFAAIELLLGQEDDDITKDLEKFIFDTSSENIRIRQAIIEKFIKENRKISNKKAVKFGPLTGGYILAEDYRIKKP